MAGDWIKIRSELLTNPKFIWLSNKLIYGDTDGLSMYVCGQANKRNERNDDVTEGALRFVTEGALRDVTLCCLMRVWFAVNAHGKVCGSDVTMSPMTVDDIDRIACCDGFGDAMLEAGWVLEASHNTLTFPNFTEFNEPSSVRGKPKTNAERQAEFRARKREERSDCDSVTKVTKRNAREEKRREEKKDINTCVTTSHDHEELDRSDDVPLEPVVAKPKQLYSDDFERFWDIYPPYRRRDKGNAWKAWQKALKSVTAEELIEKAEEYADSPVGRGEFSKLPTSWLNARGWEDDPTSWGSAPEHRPRIPTLEELANYNPNG